MKSNMKTENNKIDELNNCTFTKTILMFIIILYHCFVVCQGEGFIDSGKIQTPSYYSIILDFFSSFQNYTFVLISGYLFSYIKKERHGYETFLEFVKNKFVRLFLPFVGISLLWGIPWKKAVFGLGPREIIVQWGLAINPDQLWFILMLFEVMIVFWHIENKFHFAGFNITWSIIFGAIYFIGIIANEYLINCFRIFNTCQMLLFFYVGFCLRKSDIDRKRLRYISIAIYIPLFLLCTFFKNKTELPFVVIYRIVQLCMRCSGSLMAFSVLQRIGQKVKWADSILFRFFSKLSMPIYLLHQQIIYFVVLIVSSKVGIYSCVLISFFAALFSAIVISVLLEKNKITRYLIGEGK